MSWLRARPVVVTLVLLVAALVFRLWTEVAGARKLTEAEVAAARDGAALGLRVVLPFEPEQFHFLRLQEIGRMAGAEGHAILLGNVALADARRLARAYWVADLEPWTSQ